MVSGLFSLEGKCALVTGSTSGIGEMIATGFAERGVKVYISSRKVHACERVARHLCDLGGDVVALPADLSSEQGRMGLAARFGEQEGALDILVNNAGATWGAPCRSLTKPRGKECFASTSRLSSTSPSFCCPNCWPRPLTTIRQG